MIFASLKIYWYNKFRQFRNAIREVPYTTLTQEQKDGMLSQLWQNDAFRNYVIRRETQLMIAMTDRLMKPSDEQYLMLYGRRLELMELHDEARSTFNRTLARKKSALVKVQE